MPSKRNPLLNRPPEAPLLPNQKVTYSPDYYDELRQAGETAAANAIGVLSGHFGSIRSKPGYVVADFGRFGTYIGPLDALSSAEPHVIL